MLVCTSVPDAQNQRWVDDIEVEKNGNGNHSTRMN